MVQKMNHPNPGVRCVVNTCHYYAQGDHCNAEKIEVQHPDARTSNQTDCATFRPSQGGMQ